MNSTHRSIPPLSDDLIADLAAAFPALRPSDALLPEKELAFKAGARHVVEQLLTRQTLDKEYAFPGVHDTQSTEG